MSELAFFESGLIGAPVLILGHALGADYRVWDESAAILGREFRILRWNQPGHGRSGRGQSELLGDHRTMSRIVMLLFEGLDRLGVRQAHLAGISLGGMVSLAAAQIAPERVASLSILDAGPSLLPAQAWIERAATVRERGMESLVDGTMARWFAPEDRGEAFERTRRGFLACDPEGYAQCCEVIADTDLSPGLAALTMPTLILTGENDPGMPPEQARELAARIASADEAVVIPGAYHLTCLHDPRAVAEAITGIALAS